MTETAPYLEHSICMCRFGSKTRRSQGDYSASRRHDNDAQRTRRQSIDHQSAGPRVQMERMLDSGEFQTLKELAAHENISASYMTRVMRLTLLAPDIVEDILNNRAQALTLSDLLNPFPWIGQSNATTSRSSPL
ncbi:hypothetical protein [Celeribacter halophilus]|uniref:hypothetical protein n=1 Tax=Celeribacter halophilus TaxID=576117 RepID=UPI003A8DE49C